MANDVILFNLFYTFIYISVGATLRQIQLPVEIHRSQFRTECGANASQRHKERERGTAQ